MASWFNFKKGLKPKFDSKIHDISIIPKCFPNDWGTQDPAQGVCCPSAADSYATIADLNLIALKPQALAHLDFCFFIHKMEIIISLLSCGGCRLTEIIGAEFLFQFSSSKQSVNVSYYSVLQKVETPTWFYARLPISHHYVCIMEEELHYFYFFV